jgi:outer membrane protein TolC
LEVFMLRITPKEQDGRLILALEGKLAGPWVAELAKACSDLRGRVAARDTLVDLREVCFVDEAGRELLTGLHREGYGLQGAGAFVGPLVQSIIHPRQTGAAPLRWCWLAALGLAAGGTLAAAAEAPAPLPLTLNQAIQTALAQNSEVHRAVLAIAQSQEDRKAAAGALLPSVEGVAQGVRAKANEDQELLSVTAGRPTMLGPANWGAAGIQASVPLFDLGLWDRWKAAEKGELSAQAQARQTREQITALVVGQYLRAERSAEAVKAARSRVDLAKALERLAEDQQANGLGTRLDALRAQVQVQNEQQRLIQADTQLRTAKYGLVRALNLDPATPVEVVDTLETPALPQFSFEEAYAAGLRQRPELAALEAREQAQERLQAAARDRRLPTVRASGSYTSTGLEREPWVSTYSLMLEVRVPLFTGGRISAETARAKAELQRIQDERRSARAQVSMEVQVAQAELEAGRTEVEVAAQAQDLASQALEQARHRFEAGVSNNIEVIQAQDELARAADNKISALYRLNQSRADLARAMGQLEPLFVR